MADKVSISPQALIGFVKDMADKIVLPLIDGLVAVYNAPFQIDDKIWAIARPRIVAWIEAGKVKLVMGDDGSAQFMMDGLGDLDAKMVFPVSDLAKQFVRLVVFPAIDQAVKDKHTPLEMDDRLWALAKARLNDFLDTVTFTHVGAGEKLHFAVALK